MRTVSIKSDSKITVMAQNSNTKGLVVFFQPSEDIPIDSFKMLAAPSNTMIEGQKLNAIFTTTLAFSSILSNQLNSLFLSVVMLPLILVFSCCRRCSPSSTHICSVAFLTPTRITTFAVSILLKFKQWFNFTTLTTPFGLFHDVPL